MVRLDHSRECGKREAKAKRQTEASPRNKPACDQRSLRIDKTHLGLRFTYSKGGGHPQSNTSLLAVSWVATQQPKKMWLLAPHSPQKDPISTLWGSETHNLHMCLRDTEQVLQQEKGAYHETEPGQVASLAEAERVPSLFIGKCSWQRTQITHLTRRSKDCCALLVFPRRNNSTHQKAAQQEKEKECVSY